MPLQETPGSQDLSPANGDGVGEHLDEPVKDLECHAFLCSGKIDMQKLLQQLDIDRVTDATIGYILEKAAAGFLIAMVASQGIDNYIGVKKLQNDR
jgi:hypothetical protein